MSKVENQYGENDPKCPYCSYEVELCDLPSIEDLSEGIDFQCYKCNKIFMLILYCSYDATADCGLNEAQHDWTESEPNAYQHAVWFVCRECGEKKVLQDEKAMEYKKANGQWGKWE